MLLGEPTKSGFVPAYAEGLSQNPPRVVRDSVRQVFKAVDCDSKKDVRHRTGQDQRPKQKLEDSFPRSDF